MQLKKMIPFFQEVKLSNLGVLHTQDECKGTFFPIKTI